MEENKASMTAVLTAYARAYHATHDHPKIFDDYLANELFTEVERAYFGKGLASSLAFFDPELAAASPDEATTLAWYMRLQGGPVTLSRSRYTEDCLAAAVRRGVQQYVILGAGLETFAFRQPEVMKQLRVFEVDHPATQAFKQNRLAELGWNVPPNLYFVSVDFSSESLTAALHRSAYDPSKELSITHIFSLGLKGGRLPSHLIEAGSVTNCLRNLASLRLPGRRRNSPGWPLPMSV